MPGTGATHLIPAFAALDQQALIQDQGELGGWFLAALRGELLPLPDSSAQIGARWAAANVLASRPVANGKLDTIASIGIMVGVPFVGGSALELDALLVGGGLATEANEAVFWSGIQGGDSTAAAWVGRNGGATLETIMAQRGITLPTWDANNPAAVSAWRSASADFAAGARGNVRVLQADAVRINSVWAEVEFPALRSNPNVTSITAVNPSTGAETILWSR